MTDRLDELTPEAAAGAARNARSMSDMSLAGWRDGGHPTLSRIAAEEFARRASHTVRTERRRGFQPPYYTVVIYRCEATGIETVVRRNSRGVMPPGAIVGNCGHRVSL